MGKEVLHDAAPAFGRSASERAPLRSGEVGLERIRVLVVDDHEVFRDGLCRLLSDSGLEIVGDAASGEQALSLTATLAPDVVVMDLNLPGMSGIEATRRLSIAAPKARVLVLTISGDDADVAEAVLAGACGYLLKDASIEEIVAGVRAAAAGESLISPKVATKLLDRLRATGRPTVEGDAELSEREAEVLRKVAEGKENSDIAAELFISPQTVKNHISNILAKLQIQNRIQAAVYAVRKGIV